MAEVEAVCLANGGYYGHYSLNTGLLFQSIKHAVDAVASCHIEYVLGVTYISSFVY